jgi:hypothetical protein
VAPALAHDRERLTGIAVKPVILQPEKRAHTKVSILSRIRPSFALTAASSTGGKIKSREMALLRRIATAHALATLLSIQPKHLSTAKAVTLRSKPTLAGKSLSQSTALRSARLPAIDLSLSIALTAVFCFKVSPSGSTVTDRPK